MKTVISAAAMSVLFGLPALADRDDHHHHGYSAPGPIVGAGLPMLAVGYGVFWLVGRRRKAD
jgi:hypothetical protein